MSTIQAKLGSLTTRASDKWKDDQNLTIFSPTEESQFVICTPPLNSHQQGLKSKFLKENLMTNEDMLNVLSQQHQEMQVYTFDKVINDTNTENGGINKLYNSVVRPKIAAS